MINPIGKLKRSLKIANIHSPSHSSQRKDTGELAPFVIKIPHLISHSQKHWPPSWSKYGAPIGQGRCILSYSVCKAFLPEGFLLLEIRFKVRSFCPNNCESFHTAKRWVRQRRMHSNESELSTEKSVWYNVLRTASHCPNSKFNLASEVLQKRPNLLFQIPVSIAILSHLMFWAPAPKLCVILWKGHLP